MSECLLSFPFLSCPVLFSLSLFSLSSAWSPQWLARDVLARREQGEVLMAGRREGTKIALDHRTDCLYRYYSFFSLSCSPSLSSSSLLPPSLSSPLPTLITLRPTLFPAHFIKYANTRLGQSCHLFYPIALIHINANTHTPNKHIPTNYWKLDTS
ncbi:hypothetical protein P389DRAFT_173883 [Cystobasidium minutum MCA 4210]|uniref:uncharacterized protein n=1 Tax=Cystobasidium minutum MCA 4210 TaxID=1397322 RepID=UPI0034CED27E|eukprot:jgi/Rhomi1/173883/fgenesh1_kg.6_\